jgi:hypothetical protein
MICVFADEILVSAHTELKEEPTFLKLQSRMFDVEAVTKFMQTLCKYVSQSLFFEKVSLQF